VHNPVLFAATMYETSRSKGGEQAIFKYKCEDISMTLKNLIARYDVDEVIIDRGRNYFRKGYVSSLEESVFTYRFFLPAY
jgi:hypothetical protein